MSLWVDSVALEMLDTIGEMEGLTSRAAVVEHLAFEHIGRLEAALTAECHPGAEVS